MATITAKFSGRCRSCGGVIAAGSAIDWSKTSGSRHVKCAEDDKPSAEDLAATITITQDWRRRGTPGIGSEVGRTIRLSARDSREHADKVVTVVTQRRRFESDEDNEDMGDCMGGGWWVTLGCRPATPEETAKLEAEEAATKSTESARLAKIEIDRAAKRATIDAAKTKLADLTAGMERTESFDASVLVPEDRPNTVVSWSEWDRHHAYVVQHTAVTGETVYLGYNHEVDDDRCTLYAPRSVIEASWAALATRLGETREKAMAFLATYSRCVGADWRKWLLEQAEAKQP